jgi:adenine-specific DNA-methyltransferase
MWALQAQFKQKKPPTTYRYDPSLDPALSWDESNPGRERAEALIRRVQDATDPAYGETLGRLNLQAEAGERLPSSVKNPGRETNKTEDHPKGEEQWNM